MSDPTGDLLSELGRAKGDCARLRRRIRQLESSRAYWKAEAARWRWSARQKNGAAA